jgi:NAD(P)-dependent dehydrogenase (short-subunit alcohol dehydrogenase family)
VSRESNEPAEAGVELAVSANGLPHETIADVNAQSGKTGTPSIVYAMAKVLAIGIGPFGITANTVAPGGLVTGQVLHVNGGYVM